MALELFFGKPMVIVFGRKGTQFARFIRQGRNGNLRVRRYRAASRRWTGLVTINPAQIAKDEVGQPIIGIEAARYASKRFGSLVVNTTIAAMLAQRKDKHED